MEITEVKAENQATTLAERVSERLHREGQLAAVHSVLGPVAKSGMVRGSG